MKPMMCIGIFGLLFSITLLLLASNYSNAFGQANEDRKKFEMVLLSQKYTSTGFVDEIVGEILNNGTDTAKAVEVSANLYDDGGRIVGYEADGASPTTIGSGKSSMFTLQILDEVTKSATASYDITIKWKDKYSSNYFMRLTGELEVDRGGDDSDEDEDDSSDGDPDTDDDSDSNSEDEG